MARRLQIGRGVGEGAIGVPSLPRRRGGLSEPRIRPAKGAAEEVKLAVGGRLSRRVDQTLEAP
ncbi:hypothetical protein D3C72_2461910 [compost metagenome]